MKTFDWFQDEARRTASSTPSLAVMALGLTGEAGEVADLIKKHIGHGHDLDRVKLTKELGDVLWYLAALADLAGVSLEVVAAMNVEKLRKRYPAGFSSEASKARVDTVGADVCEPDCVTGGSVCRAFTDCKNR